MKKSILFLLFTISTLASCASKTKGTHEATIITCGTKFSDAFSVHTDLVNTDYSAELKSFFQSQITDKNVISNLSYSYLNVNVYNETSYLTCGTGYFLKENKYNAGNLTITSKYEISSVSVSAKAYMNAYEGYGAQQGTMVYQPDYTAHILIDDIDTSLEVSSTAHDTETKVAKIEYASPVKSFTIKSKNARVFIESISITYIS